MKFSTYLKESHKFTSQFNIGDSVTVHFPDGKELKGFIRCVIFTNGKVRYSVRIEIEKNKFTTLHNIDSILVKTGKDKNSIETLLDNYS
jgi:hypothetical protein